MSCATVENLHTKSTQSVSERKKMDMYEILYNQYLKEIRKCNLEAYLA